MRGLLAPLIKLIVFLVVTTTTTVVLAGIINNSAYGDIATYSALFGDSSGIGEGDDVRIAGVRVGTIESVQLVREGGEQIAKITFTVMKDRPLPETTLAQIRYRNLVGQRYLDISQGGTGESTTMLDPGATLPRRGQSALDLTLLFQGFQPLIKGLGADQLNKLSENIVLSLQGEGDAIANLFSTVADLTNGLADKDAVIGNVITDLTRTLTILGNNDTQLSNLIIQLRRFVGGLADDRDAIGDAIVGISKLATRTSDLLTDVRAPLAKDIRDLTGLVGVLNDNQPELQELLTELPPTVGALIRTASYGSWFNFYICDVAGTVTLPDGTKRDLIKLDSNAARCN